MGIFDIFKKKKGANAEIDRGIELNGIVYDSNDKLEKIKLAYSNAKSMIEKDTSVSIDKREVLFETIKQNALDKLAELLAEVENLVEKFKESAAPEITLEIMRVADKIKKEIKKINDETLTNGPSGPAGPQ